MPIPGCRLPHLRKDHRIEIIMQPPRTESVTVIVSTFNRAHFLREALDSVLAQSRPPEQVIVVNDGSTDNTATVLAAYTGMIVVIEQPNSGKPAAVNTAYRLATGSYLWIFDDDDVALSDFLERHVRCLEENPGIGFTYSNYRRGKSGADGTIIDTGDSGVPDVDSDVFLIRLLENCFLTTQGMLIRRSALRRPYVFDERLVRSQDYELFVHLARNAQGKRVAEPSYIRRYHPGVRGSLEDRFSVEALESKWYQYEKLATAGFFATAGLEQYLPMSMGALIDDPAMQRRALIQKLSILARKGLWDEFARTSTILAGTATPSTPAEYDIILGACRKDLAVRELLADAGARKRVLAAVRRHFNARLRSGLGRSLWYELSDRNNCLSPAERIGALALVVAILGVGGIADALRRNTSSPGH